MTVTGRSIRSDDHFGTKMIREPKILLGTRLLRFAKATAYSQTLCSKGTSSFASDKYEKVECGCHVQIF